MKYRVVVLYTTLHRIVKTQITVSISRVSVSISLGYGLIIYVFNKYKILYFTFYTFSDADTAGLGPTPWEQLTKNIIYLVFSEDTFPFLANLEKYSKLWD